MRDWCNDILALNRIFFILCKIYCHNNGGTFRWPNYSNIVCCSIVTRPSFLEYKTKSYQLEEEEKNMSYITSFERIGIQKGMQEGMQQGRIHFSLGAFRI